MLKEYHGRWKHLPEVVVNVSAETASKARYLIYLRARDAYPEVKLTDIQVRSGQFILNPLAWDDNAQHRVHQTAGGRRSKKSKLVVPAAGKA